MKCRLWYVWCHNEDSFLGCLIPSPLPSPLPSYQPICNALKARLVLAAPFFAQLEMSQKVTKVVQDLGAAQLVLGKMRELMKR